jgi:transposase
MSTLYVGIDLAQNSFAACFMLADGTEACKRCKLDNTPHGASELVNTVLVVAQRHHVKCVLFGMEATGLLGWHLAEFLRASTSLGHLEREVHCLNARQISNFKKSMAETSKTDPADAFAIAERLRFGRLPHPSIPDETYLALQRLTRHRFHLVNSLAREKNRFLSHLFLKCNAFCQEAPFSDTFGATSSALLTEFLTAEEIASQSIEDLANFIKEKGKNQFADPEKTAAIVQQAARNSYSLRKCLTNPVNVILSMTLENVRFFEKQIQAIDKAIARELQGIPTAVVLLSVPGLGSVFTAGILAEVQDIHRFDSDDALARFAALVWKQTQSGDFDADETRMLHSGNSYLRYYLVEAANSVRMHNEEYSAYYQSKLREATTHRHKRACVLTARKLVRLIHFLLSKGQIYQPPTARKEMPAQLHPDTMPRGEIARHVIQRRRTVAAKRSGAAG